jgi:hypothetical protein
MKLNIWGFFENVSRELEFHCKSDKNKWYFTWRPIYVFLSYRAHFFLEWEIFQTKVVEKFKTHILCSVTPPLPRKIVPFMR